MVGLYSGNCNNQQAKQKQYSTGKMKIVATGDYMFNGGDVSWQAIEAFGGLTTYERTPAGLVVERCRDAEIILINKTPLSRATFEQLPKLKMVSVLATGYNMVDTVAAREKNIIVCNAPAYGTASVAQHTFALILELTNHVGVHAASVAAGDWTRTKDWCYNKTLIIGLEGKTIGIVGFGNIGRETAKIAMAFGMKVLYYSGHKKDDDYPAQYVTLQTLFEQSDILSLHCPLTANNNMFVNKQLLGLMKPSAMLVNTARGQLINEADLAFALNNNVIAGAALDVLSVEPPTSDNPLFKAKNCIITPHNAWMSTEARQRILDITAQNIQAYLDGKPINVVN
jgi:glycerate dehydrogenase